MDMASLDVSQHHENASVMWGTEVSLAIKASREMQQSFDRLSKSNYGSMIACFNTVNRGWLLNLSNHYIKDTKWKPTSHANPTRINLQINVLGQRELE